MVTEKEHSAIWLGQDVRNALGPGGNAPAILLNPTLDFSTRRMKSWQKLVLQEMLGPSRP